MLYTVETRAIAAAARETELGKRGQGGRPGLGRLDTDAASSPAPTAPTDAVECDGRCLVLASASDARCVADTPTAPWPDPGADVDRPMSVWRPRPRPRVQRPPCVPAGHVAVGLAAPYYAITRRTTSPQVRDGTRAAEIK